MKLTRPQLNNIIREVLTEVEFHGETPEGQLYGTEEEDARFEQQLSAERVMESAKLTPEEIAFVQQAMQNPRKHANEFAESPAYEKLLDYFLDQEVMPYEVASQDMSAKTTPEIWILSYLAEDPAPDVKPLKLSTPKHDPLDISPRGRRRRHGKEYPWELREGKYNITKSQLMQIIKEELERALAGIN